MWVHGNLHKHSPQPRLTYTSTNGFWTFHLVFLNSRFHLISFFPTTHKKITNQFASFWLCLKARYTGHVLINICNLCGLCVTGYVTVTRWPNPLSFMANGKCIDIYFLIEYSYKEIQQNFRTQQEFQHIGSSLKICYQLEWDKVYYAYTW